MSKTDIAAERKNLNAVQKDGLALQFIKNPSEAVQMAAVKNCGEAIRFIKNPSETVQMAAVKNCGEAIRFIKNPSETVQTAAVKDILGSCIRYIKNPSETVLLESVRNNGLTVRYIKNPSEAVQLHAVRDNAQALRHIKRPSAAARLTAFSSGGGLQVAGAWPKGFQPSALDLRRAIQDSGIGFAANKPRPGTAGADRIGKMVDRHEEKVYSAGINTIVAILKKQPSADILELADIAPTLFEAPELRRVLRDALLKQADPSNGLATPRPL